MTTHELETGQTILLEVVPKRTLSITFSDIVIGGKQYLQILPNYPVGDSEDLSAQVVTATEITPEIALAYAKGKQGYAATGKHKYLEVIGTVQYPDVISFDCAPFVESLIIRTEVPARAAGFRDWHAFRNYMKDKYPNACKTKEASFLSLLQSLGRYWVNPLGEEPNINDPKYDAPEKMQRRLLAHWEHDHIQWELAESRKLSVEQMVVVIQIKKP